MKQVEAARMDRLNCVPIKRPDQTCRRKAWSYSSSLNRRQTYSDRFEILRYVSTPNQVHRVEGHHNLSLLIENFNQCPDQSPIGF